MHNDGMMENSEKLLKGSQRNLRKRKNNLHLLSNPHNSPLICQVPHCGIQLKDGDSLDWHYEGHLASQLEKLKKYKVKKSSIRSSSTSSSFPSDKRAKIRYFAFEKIKFRRESRKAFKGSRISTSASVLCPICDVVIVEEETKEEKEKDNYNETNVGLKNHLEICLETLTKTEEEEEEYSTSTFEEYEWAGQTRVRATAFLEEDLSHNSGFLKIKRSNEDEVLDIEGEEFLDVGPIQYTESDLLLLSADNETEEKERRHLRSALGHDSKSHTEIPVVRDEYEDETQNDVESISELETLKKKFGKLLSQNEDYKRRTSCNVCMDSYNKPLVSLTCWHVHCEECWLRALGAKKLCPQCKVILRPEDLRKIYL